MALAQGSTGDQVVQLQQRLAELGFDPGPVDGIFGPRTAAAVAQAQAAGNADVDGLVGPQTQGVLDNAGSSGGGIEPEQDPQFLAFQRALGVEESELRASIAMRASAVQRRVANQLPQIQQQTQEGVRTAGLSAEARGVFKGGNRVRNQTDILNQGAMQQQGVVAGGQEEIASMESELARQIAANRRRQAETELDTRQSLATGYATSNGLS